MESSDGAQYTRAQTNKHKEVLKKNFLLQPLDGVR